VIFGYATVAAALQRQLESLHLPPTLSGPGQEHEKCFLEFAHHAKQR
jgi:hypothetical protein